MSNVLCPNCKEEYLPGSKLRGYCTSCNREFQAIYRARYRRAWRETDRLLAEARKASLGLKRADSKKIYDAITRVISDLYEVSNR